MTREELLLAVGHIEEDLLANCDAQRKAPRKRMWKIAAVAASFACIVLGATVARKDAPTPVIPEQTEPRWECSLLSTMNGSSAGFGLTAADASAVWNRGTFQDAAAPQEMTITFDGKTYTGNYSYSICVVGCGYIKDYYQSEDPRGAFSEFSIRRETGALTGIHFATREFFARNAETPVLEDPSNMLPDMAKQWASHFIDVEAYEMYLYRTIPQQDPKMTTYIYEFVKKANGLDTTDWLQVMLSDRGILGYIGMKQPGWVDEQEEQLQAFASVDPKALIQRDTALTNVAVRKQYYGITPEGKVVLLVNCSVTVQGGMSAGATIVIENTAQ